MLQYESDPQFRAIAQAAVRVESETGFPAAITLAMWACESSWGKSATGDFNYFGITRAPELGPAKLCPTHEDIEPADLSCFRLDEQATAVKGTDLGNGKFRYSMSRWFASYTSLDEALTDYVNLFVKSPQRYTAAWRQYLADKEKYPTLATVSLLRAICAAGYATGDAEKTEEAIEAQANVQHAIQQARTAAQNRIATA